MTKAITHRPLKAPGRKLTVAPANAAATIAELAADGWSMVGIAHRMGVDAKTFRRWLEDDPALNDAIELGREQQHHVLYNIAYRRAVEKEDLTAVMFLLNSRFGYRTDLRDQGNRVNVTIALPGAMTLQQFNSLSKGQDNGQGNPG